MSPPNRTPPEGEPSRDGPLVIDCDDCAMQGTEACADCVVTFICSREPGEAVIVDVEEERDGVRSAIRQARVRVEVNGRATTMISARFRGPDSRIERRHASR